MAAPLRIDPQNALAHIGRASAYLMQERSSDAAAARQAISCQPDSGPAHRVLAAALLREGDRREANKEAMCTVALDPEAYRGFIVLSETLLATDDLPGALQAAQHATAFAPEQAAPHTAVAIAKLRHEDAAGAEAAARDALRLDPRIRSPSITSASRSDANGDTTKPWSPTSMQPSSPHTTARSAATCSACVTPEAEST